MDLCPRVVRLHGMVARLLLHESHRGAVVIEPQFMGGLTWRIPTYNVPHARPGDVVLMHRSDSVWLLVSRSRFEETERVIVFLVDGELRRWEW